MQKKLPSDSSLARNVVLNFLGLGVPLIIGVVTIPVVVRGLGVERYGLLSLLWVILGYFTIFDLGLGRATTKYVAEALGDGQKDKVPKLVWTAVVSQALLGLLGAAVLVVITPLLVDRVLDIPLPLKSEAKTTFYLLAFAIPIVLVSSSFSGILEAAQRFDLVNAVKIPSNLLTFLLPLAGLKLGFSLIGIVTMVLIARAIACITLLLLDLRIFPNLKRVAASFELFTRLFAFGGWVTVSSTVGPLLVYLDRFLIASLLSLSAVTYYTAPYEAVTRLWIVPGSLALTLFPTFSASRGIDDRTRIGTLFARSVKYTFLALAPLTLIVVLFAEDLLKIWMGGDFAVRSSPVMKILAAGVLINSLAHVPYALLQGVGRPDITAKFHLIELSFYLAAAWLLIREWGIAGAAAAWTLRVTFDTLLLFIAAFKICNLSPRLFTTNRLMLASFALLLLTAAAYELKNIASALPLLVQSILFVPVFALSALVVWKNILDASDRGALVSRVMKP